MSNAKTSKTDTKSDASSPHGETQKVNLLEMVKDIASLKATVRLLVIAMLLMLSVMGWGFNFILGEIEEVETEIKQVETMVGETHEIAVRNSEQIEQIRTISTSNSKKLNAFINFTLAKESGDAASIDAARRALMDALAETAIDIPNTPPSTTTSDVSDAGDASSTTSPSESDEALVVAPGDGLGDALGETRIEVAQQDNLPL